MISLIAWLIGLLIIVLIVRYIVDSTGLDGRAKQIVWLILGFAVVLVILTKLQAFPGWRLP